MTDKPDPQNADYLMQELTSPTGAAVLSVLRGIGAAITAMVAIWHYVATGNLVGLYQWAHSSQAAGAGSAALALALIGYGGWKQWRKTTTINAGKAVMQGQIEPPPGSSVISVGPPAPPNAADTIDALRKGQRP